MVGEREDKDNSTQVVVEVEVEVRVELGNYHTRIICSSLSGLIKLSSKIKEKAGYPFNIYFGQLGKLCINFIRIVEM